MFPSIMYPNYVCWQYHCQVHALILVPGKTTEISQ